MNLEEKGQTAQAAHKPDIMIDKIVDMLPVNTLGSKELGSYACKLIHAYITSPEVWLIKASVVTSLYENYHMSWNGNLFTKGAIEFLTYITTTKSDHIKFDDLMFVAPIVNQYEKYELQITLIDTIALLRKRMMEVSIATYNTHLRTSYGDGIWSQLVPLLRLDIGTEELITHAINHIGYCVYSGKLYGVPSCVRVVASFHVLKWCHQAIKIADTGEEDIIRKISERLLEDTSDDKEQLMFNIGELIGCYVGVTKYISNEEYPNLFNIIKMATIIGLSCHEKQLTDKGRLMRLSVLISLSAYMRHEMPDSACSQLIHDGVDKIEDLIRYTRDGMDNSRIEKIVSSGVDLVLALFMDVSAPTIPQQTIIDYCGPDVWL